MLNKAIEFAARGQSKLRHSLPWKNKENNVISNCPLLPARWDDAMI